MNQKNYKKIAEILHKWSYDNHQIIAEELADYFEEEIEERIKYMKKHPKVFAYGEEEELKKNGFNRKQFLKDCGVEE